MCALWLVLLHTREGVLHWIVRLLSLCVDHPFQETFSLTISIAKLALGSVMLGGSAVLNFQVIANRAQSTSL
mgnify:CR=1 FL=1